MRIPVNSVVNVTIRTSPTFPERKGFGALLVIGSSAVLPTAERMREYSDVTAVATDFGSNSEEYKASLAFFSQSPSPNSIFIGRRFTTAVGGSNLGSLGYTSSMALWQAVTAGSFRVVVDGTARTVSSLNFSTDVTLTQVASRIQTALIAAGASGATVSYTGRRFVVTSGSTGVASSVGYTTDSGAGTYIGNMLGTDASKTPLLSTGAAAESAAQCLTNMQNFSTTWYGVTFTNHASEQDLKDAAGWCEAMVKIFGYTAQDFNCKDSLQTTDIGSYMSQQGFRRTLGIFDTTDPYAVCSALARGFVVNFQEQNSTITLKFKTLPGQSPENLRVDEKRALDGKNLNYYTRFGDSAMLAEGVMADGTFFDEVHGLDWLQNAVETNVFGFMYTRKTKIPQTDRGMQLLVQQVELAMDEGVNNGLLAPGTWNGGEFGQLKTEDFLETGYYVYASKMDTQNSSDREARIAPPIQVAAKGSGAIHFASVGVVFDR